MTDVARRVLEMLSPGGLRATRGVQAEAEREEEELLALLPWLQLGPPKPPAPPAPAPAAGSLEEILSILPWLEEPDPSPLTGLEGPGDVDFDLPTISAAAEEEAGAEAVVREPSDQKATIGVNAPKIREYENDSSKVTYGDTDAILGDLDTLGAQFFRQPSHADLGWPAHQPVPVVTLGTEIYPDLLGVGGDGDLVTDLLELLKKIVPYGTSGAKAADYPSGVVLTLFTGGSNTFALPDSSGEYYLTTGVIGLDWEDGHRANNETLWNTTPYAIHDYYSADDGHAAAYDDSDAAISRDDRGWVNGSLDLRSFYKLKYLYHIGCAYGTLLRDVNALLLADPAGYDEIWDTIVGVEIFNEINHSNPFELKTDGRTTLLGYVETTIGIGARFWSWAVREFVRGLQHSIGLGAKLDGSPITLPLWLPSIAMYTSPLPDLVTNAPPTFRSLLFFQYLLCEFLVRDFTGANDMSDNPGAYYDEAGAPLDDPLGVTFSWFRNQDYHYYSYKPGQSAGTFLRLATEMHALRDAFRDVGTPGHTSTEPGGTGLNALATQRVTLSVCENGAAANADNIDMAVFPYMDPNNLSPSGLSGDADRFQARELWRRLSVAATGARYVGWHTHISFLADSHDSTDPFKYLGLRIDNALSRDAATTYASNANQRLSHWAYQRLTELVHTADTRFHGTLVARLATALPPPITDDYYRGYYVNQIGWAGIAIHFIVGPHKHAYLLMIDPTAQVDPMGTTGLTAHAELSTISGGQTHFETWATIPAGFISTSPGASHSEFSTSTPDESSVAWFTPVNHVRFVSTIRTATLGADSDPILIRCGEPLNITWVQETPT